MLTVAWLAGCASRESGIPPGAQVTPPVAWRVQAGPSARIERDWWQRYGDPVLTTLVERALRNNTEVAIAIARVEQARAQERIARAQLFPSLDFSTAAARSRSVNAFGMPRVMNSVEPEFVASYEVDLFGRVHDLTRAAGASRQATEAARDAVILSVASSTAQSYITLRALDVQLDVLKQTLTSREAALRLARSEAAHGYSSALELAQARAEYEATAQAVPQTELAIARQENALSVLVGDGPRAIERGAALDDLRMPPVPDGLPADVLRRRPDIAQAEYQLAASDANLAVARKSFLPQLRLSGSAGLLAATGLNNPVTIWSLGGSILSPIFEGGRLAAGVDSAAAQRDEAAFAYKRTVLAAFREVNDNLAALHTLDDRVRHIQEQRNALADALRHATKRYQAGYSPYLEQLDAQRGLLNAQLSLIQARADQFAASVALYQAMGGGWGAPGTQGTGGG